METFLTQIIHNPYLHQKWLNTISLMEFMGASHIMRTHRGLKINPSILQHASEEIRHAHFFKKQIAKLSTHAHAAHDSHAAYEGWEDYQLDKILGGAKSKNYVTKIDMQVSRLLKQKLGLRGEDLKQAAYYLTTYIIEVRAMKLYPGYQNLLKEMSSPVNLQSVLSEEDRHLEEMERMIHQSPYAVILPELLSWEEEHYLDWKKSVIADMMLAN